jgi:putative oxidoreductase
MATSTFSTRSQAITQAPALAGPLVLLGRFFFVLIFLMAGPTQLASQTIAYAASQGVPMASILVPLAGAISFFGALSVLLGYHARIGAWMIVLFLAVVTPTMHRFWTVADPMMHQMQMINFMKNLSMLGGALLISQFGAGPWSLDHRRS